MKEINYKVGEVKSGKQEIQGKEEKLTRFWDQLDKG